MSDNYAIRNLRITQGTQLDRNGVPQATMRVSYYVGDDGPFTDSYPAHGFTDAQANAGIAARVAQLRAIRTASAAHT